MPLDHSIAGKVHNGDLAVGPQRGYRAVAAIRKQRVVPRLCAGLPARAGAIRMIEVVVVIDVLEGSSASAASSQDGGVVVTAAWPVRLSTRLRRCFGVVSRSGDAGIDADASSRLRFGLGSGPCPRGSRLRWWLFDNWGSLGERWQSGPPRVVFSHGSEGQRDSNAAAWLPSTGSWLRPFCLGSLPMDAIIVVLFFEVRWQGCTICRGQ